MDKTLWQSCYLAGQSVQDIASNSGCTKMTVYRYLRLLKTPDQVRTTRRCYLCKQTKSLKEFYPQKDTASGYGYQCKKCRPPYKGRNCKKYGLTKDKLDEMMKAQDNKCAVCGETSQKALHIDHCHATGVVRGLLCNNCNTGIGFFRDNPELLKNAADYLNDFRGSDKET